MSEKLGRRGLFGLFAKAAVAAPFVGKAMAEAASAAPVPLDERVVESLTRPGLRVGYVGGYPAFTISTYCDMVYRSFSDADRSILEHHCEDETCWCHEEDADY